MKRSKALLITVMFLCGLMVGDRLFKFAATRIPPYGVGTCLFFQDFPALKSEIVHNNYLTGYSDVRITMTNKFYPVKEDTKVSFQELRATPMKEDKCD